MSVDSDKCTRSEMLNISYKRYSLIRGEVKQLIVMWQ
jgi:hypothetical protein